MGSLVEDAQESAQWIAAALTSSGFSADFSAPSLWSIDRFFDEHAPGGTARRGGLLTSDLGSRLFAVGAYTGEVIRRSVGGTWHADDDDPQGEVNLQLVLTDGAVIWPVQRIMKRFSNGPVDGIAAYGSALGLEVGSFPAEPSPKKRRLFGR